MYNYTLGFKSWKKTTKQTRALKIQIQLSLVMRKPVYAICEKQRRRSASASAQSDQRLCCSLPGQYNTSTCCIKNFKALASFCSWADRFEPYLVENPTKWLCVQWRLRSVWSESSLSAQWVAKIPRFLHADSKVSGQTGRMLRLIWVFARRTCHFLVLSWGSSYVDTEGEK